MPIHVALSLIVFSGSWALFPNKAPWDAGQAVVLFALLIKSFQVKGAATNRLIAEMHFMD